ncbi:SET domain-containing protein [Legionella israelensis]|uniref:SET domain-containing protein n=1 Tax=Legionella israelensis TaxID=454 RepID=A0A0W0VTM0_9GAMM|nr:SET domain-containing protein [Legionella israelensis]KTD23423.1 hypothetical protein Lisr_1421 [Legionella israelensis]QBS08744.1 SET domain-containing protein [Legionella israelensis]SCY48168.1 hypothetical protein SAMN02746069_02608 [Legionella israelensis DSM 19235]STX58419.1 Uncharacterised protein [Legionella israelensis]
MPHQEIFLFPSQSTIKFFNNIEDVRYSRCIEKSVNEIENLFKQHRKLPHFKWTNNPVFTHKQAEDIHSMELYDFPCFESTNSFFQTSPINLQIDISKLAICYVNEHIGYGVVATEKIPRNRWMLFNGEVIECSEQEYKIYLENNVYISFIKNVETGQGYMLDARAVAGFASLVSASIDKDYVAELAQDKRNNIEQIATANFFVKPVWVNMTPQLALVTSRDIKPGELLLGNYHKSYFLQFPGSFVVLNKDGSIAAKEICDFVDKKNEEFILNRNKVNASNLNPDIVTMLCEIDQKQILYRHRNYPRVFFNQEVFIVYPESFIDLLKLATVMLINYEVDLAQDVLQFLKKLNDRFHTHQSHYQEVLKGIEEIQIKIDRSALMEI